ncbi:ABC transporter permease [Pelagibacterium xiamenense]|uniref:ABC transporter permease n=1 Tax=Pelagibacterium xiamenense TaxID=2901140 RepID=UPI001E5B49B2|nr:ABC transporter permease [Pelagibacterium xiamenense]MCD7060619.1 ABC transporter permease [Pelagibacterium xiamenense]
MSDETNGVAMTGAAASKRTISVPECAALVLFLLLEILFFALNSPYFLTWPNWVNIFTAMSITGILAAGGTILLIGGQFDLSVGSGMAFVALVFALAAQQFGIAPAVLIALATGIGIGVLNGFLVTVVGVNALITTLGTLAIFRGLTLSIGGASSVRINGFDWAILRPLFDIPLSAALFVVVAIVVGVLLARTVFGRTIYAIGANEAAARLVGIRTKTTLFLAFIGSGLCMALTGLVSASQLGSTSGTTGVGLELAVVTAIILGGTTLKGGTGSMFGTVLGLLIVGVLNNGMTLMNINSTWQQVAAGTLLILAVSFDQIRQRFIRG